MMNSDTIYIGVNDKPHSTEEIISMPYKELRHEYMYTEKEMQSEYNYLLADELTTL